MRLRDKEAMKTAEDKPISNFTSSTGGDVLVLLGLSSLSSSLSLSTSGSNTKYVKEDEEGVQGYHVGDSGGQKRDHIVNVYDYLRVGVGRRLREEEWRKSGGRQSGTEIRNQTSRSRSRSDIRIGFWGGSSS